MAPIEIQLRLHPREPFYPTNKEFQLVNDIYPVYYKIDTYAYYGKRYGRVTYEIYFAENGAIGLNSMDIYNYSFGYHPKDIERVIILHDQTTLNPVLVFFSAHAQEGKWYSINDCMFDQGRLVVFCALNSHSMHPKPGTQWRILGLANDYYSDNGPRLNLILIKDESINYRAQNEEVINTPMKKFLLPFYKNIIPNLKKQQAAYEMEINKGI